MGSPSQPWRFDLGGHGSTTAIAHDSGNIVAKDLLLTQNSILGTRTQETQDNNKQQKTHLHRCLPITCSRDTGSPIMPRRREPHSRKETFVSLICAACALLLLIAIIGFPEFHSGDAATLDAFYEPPSKQQQDLQRRFLQEIILDGSDINDDITRDATCKEYMSKFLNGTTDFRDECNAMYNAYQAADCTDDTDTVIMARKKKHHHDDDKTNSTDDDVLIDDFCKCISYQER